MAHEDRTADDEGGEEDEGARHDDEEHVLLQKGHGLTQEVGLHMHRADGCGLVFGGGVAHMHDLSQVAGFFLIRTSLHGTEKGEGRGRAAAAAADAKHSQQANQMTAHREHCFPSGSAKKTANVSEGNVNLTNRGEAQNLSCGGIYISFFLAVGYETWTKQLMQPKRKRHSLR